jgi:hypothetical protein
MQTECLATLILTDIYKTALLFCVLCSYVKPRGYYIRLCV